MDPHDAVMAGLDDDDDETRSCSTMFPSDDDELDMSSSEPSAAALAQPFATPTAASPSPRRRSVRSCPPKPHPIRTPSSPMTATILHNSLPSAPASPPTPAPSPSPRHRLPDWSTADEQEESFMREARKIFFQEASTAQKERVLAEILNLCDNRMLNFVHDFVSPRLKKDPFASFPNEICLRILSFVDHPRTLARSSQVSRRWHELVNDDMAWKNLCEKEAYRRMSTESDVDIRPYKTTTPVQSNPAPFVLAPRPASSSSNSNGGGGGSGTSSSRSPFPTYHGASNSAPDLTSGSPLDPASSARTGKNRARYMSYRSHFKRKYMVETAWRSGGKVESKFITPDQGVVTSLHLTDKYIVVALDNAKIHVFDASGRHQKTLHGHVMGVWAMVPWDDYLVSGGCDRDVRVWNMATGKNVHVLRGHSSTVRCLKMSDADTAITGSRDTTLRIWDVKKGFCKHVLVGHQASVRCVDVHGDLVASGSYDTHAKIWSISEGRCVRTLTGHFSQIYAIAFDGKRVATGSLDTSVRIWNPHDGQCLGVLQGHTSLVGQLQLRGNTLVTGGSDGSVRVWSLEKLVPIHRLAAHDNSVTSLQFNDSRIVSGGSDGRVKIWDLQHGTLVRELTQPAEAIWRISFTEEKAVILLNRGGRTILELYNFSPPDDELMEL